MAAHRVNLIDKDDARRMVFSFFEEVAHPRSSDAYKHLHKFRSANAVESNTGFACYCTRDERLTRTRSAYQEYTFGNTRAHGDKARWVLEKLYDFLKLHL